MSEEKKYPHRNHRKRVRDAFKKNGFENTGDRNLLEMLLFYSIPRRDTNPIADELLKKYGTLDAVLNAPYEELEKFEGMGESSALLLSMLPEINKRCSEKKTNPAQIDNVKELVFEKLKDEEKELMLMLSFDALDRLVDMTVIAQGNETGVTADKRTILEKAFSSDADTVILAHNHPLGEAAPSKEDVEMTKETALLLAQTGIRLRDHIIVSKNDVLSLAETEKFGCLFNLNIS